MLIKESAIRHLVSQLLLEEIEEKNPAGFNSATASRWEKVCDDAKAEAKNAIDALKGYTTKNTTAALSSTIKKIEEFKKIGKGADAYGTAQKAANELGSRARGEKNNISLALITIASLVRGDREYKFNDADVVSAAKDLGIKYGDITGPKGLKDDLDAIRSKLDKWLDAFIAMVSYAYNPDDLGDDYVPETPEERHQRVLRHFDGENPSDEEVPGDTNDSEVVATQTPVSKDSMMIVFKGIIGDSTSGGWKNPATNNALKSYLNASGVKIVGTTIDDIMNNGWAQEGPKIKSLDVKDVPPFSGDMSGLYKFVTEIEAIKRAKSIVVGGTVAESILRRLISEELTRLIMKEDDAADVAAAKSWTNPDWMRSQTDDLEDLLQQVIKKDRFWGDDIDKKLKPFFQSIPKNITIGGATFDEIISGGWKASAPKIKTFQGQPVQYSGDPNGLLKFIRNLSAALQITRPAGQKNFLQTAPSSSPTVTSSGGNIKKDPDPAAMKRLRKLLKLNETEFWDSDVDAKIASFLTAMYKRYPNVEISLIKGVKGTLQDLAKYRWFDTADKIGNLTDKSASGEINTGIGVSYYPDAKSFLKFLSNVRDLEKTK